MHYVIGTRGSKLALAQAENIKARLEKEYRSDTFEIVSIKTTGDKIPDRALEEIGSKGIFTDEIENKLLAGEIAMAVHSMKDMPSEIHEDLTFAKAWDREDARDVLILRDARSIDELPFGAVIGTGSKRRGYQLKALREDLRIVNIRGNVDTRIRKLYDPAEGLDGIIVAAAGVKRLHREDEITTYLSYDEMIPAPTQGILAIELRKDNTELLEKLNALADEKIELAARMERQFLRDIGGDCHYPIGAFYDGESTFYALFGKEDGSKLASARVSVDTSGDIENLVKDVVAQISRELGEE